MKQMVDLEGSQEFQSLNVALVSIATDPVAELALAAREFAVRTPLLSDAGSRVSQGYGVLRWAMPSDEPGHTLVLLGEDGRVKWVKDYGAPENGGLMYVPVDQLLKEIRSGLASP